MGSLDHPSREHSWEKGPHWKTSENQDGMVKSSYLSANFWDIFFKIIAIYAGILSHVWFVIEGQLVQSFFCLFVRMMGHCQLWPYLLNPPFQVTSRGSVGVASRWAHHSRLLLQIIRRMMWKLWCRQAATNCLGCFYGSFLHGGASKHLIFFWKKTMGRTGRT